MSAQDNREKRALDALIVSRLRLGCGDQVDATKLPVLSEEEKASLNCLKPGFIQSLIEGTGEQEEESNLDESAVSQEVCDRELIHGLNRAEEIDEETDEELKQKRQEMLDKLREEKDGERDRKDG